MAKEEKTPVSSPSGQETPALESLTKGRLLVALNALLSRRNVTKAAHDLGVQTSALSRMLAQLREELGDPLFVRSGRGLVPTPFAESLRPRVHAVAKELEAIFATPAPVSHSGAPFDTRWNVPSQFRAAPLAVRPAHLLDGEPSHHEVVRKLEQVADDAPPQKRLARHIGMMGIAGGGNGRPLTIEEAEEALDIILAGQADPVQIGALLGMMRLRGTTAAELAGVVRAVQRHTRTVLGTPVQASLTADLDWPCYTSPHNTAPPWFFHAARLVAQAGVRVLMHGSTGTGAVAGRYEVIAKAVGIPVCSTAAECTQALATRNIAYMPLVTLAPQVYRLLGLHGLLEVRSLIFESLPMIRPANSKTSLLGVTKPSYKELHRDTAMLLGWSDLSILGSVRDIAQFSPFRLTSLHQLIDGKPRDVLIPALMAEPPVAPRPRGTPLEYWEAVWTGAMRDARAEQIIVSTAAFALFAIPGRAATFDAALEQARGVWKDRLTAPTQHGVFTAENGRERLF